MAVAEYPAGPGDAGVPLLPFSARIMLTVVGLGCLILALTGSHDFPSLHIVLDTSMFVLTLTLTILLFDLGSRSEQSLPLWLSISFGTTAFLAMLHVAVSLDWSGPLAWIAGEAALLRPATWPPAVHVLPLGAALALSPWCAPGKRRVLLFGTGLLLLSALLVWLFSVLPRYTAPGAFGITRPSLLLAPLLWALVGIVSWRRRTRDRLLSRLSLMAAILGSASLVMLYSRSPHDTNAMIAHLGQVGGFMVLLLSLMQLAATEMSARVRAERELADLNREAEQRIRDRTERVNATNQQLEREMLVRATAEERFRAVVEHAASGMVMVDRQGIIALVNRQAEVLFGYSREELLGQSIELLVPGRFRPAHPANRAGFHDQPVARSMGAGRDLFGLRKDGREVPVEIGINPIETADGTFVLASIVDISARKQSEDELRRSNEELERFAYVASHDLQEPLRMVGNYVQLLAKRYRGRLDADADDFIGFAVDGAVRMQRLIEDLLAFSRVGSRGGALGSVDLDAVATRVLADLKVAIAEAGATVTKDRLPMVHADETQMAQLLTNLLSNAFKFRGPVPSVVHLGAKLAGDQWRLTVQDNGIGIDPQYFERIFVLFQRLHTREQYGGTGIGLAIARKIVERHGGRIGVDSKPGEGSTFHFTVRPAESIG